MYKYLVEKSYLPNLFHQSFLYIFHNSEIDKVLQKQIEEFICIANCDSFFYNRELLISFYISFKFLDDDIPFEKQIKNKLNSLDSFKIYFGTIFSSSSLNSIFDFFQNSLLGEISFEDVNFLINTFKICKGHLPEETIFIKNYFINFKKVLNNSLNLNIKRDLFIDRFLSRVSSYSNQNHCLPIFEMSFLNLNLDKLTIERCIILFKELRKIYWNISFTNVISLYLYVNSTSEKEDTKKLVVVYDSIPKYLLEQLKNKVETNNNIIITNFISINFFNDFTKFNDIQCVGIFEETLKNSFGDLEVKCLTLPI